MLYTFVIISKIFGHSRLQEYFVSLGLILDFVFVKEIVKLKIFYIHLLVIYRTFKIQIKSCSLIDFKE